MTTRQKFWLKVVLAVTFPVWVLPVVVAGILWAGCKGVGLIIWEAVSSIVEPREKTWGDM